MRDAGSGWGSESGRSYGSVRVDVFLEVGGSRSGRF